MTSIFTISLEIMADESLLHKRPGDPENLASASERSRVASKDQELQEPSTSSDNKQDDVDGAELKNEEVFLLTKYLPAKIVESSRANPNELTKNLLPSLEIRVSRANFPEDISLIDLSLPENYSNELGNNSDLLGKILGCFMTELAKQAVKMVDKVIFPPQVDISNIPGILSNCLSQSISIDCIEIPSTANTAQSIPACLHEAVDVAISFGVAKILFTDPLNMLEKQLKPQTKQWKSFHDEMLQKYPDYKKPLLVKIRRRVVIGQSQKVGKEPSQKRKKMQTKKQSFGHSGDLNSFTNDGIHLPIHEVSCITAYEYWNLTSIHGMKKDAKKSYRGNGTVVAILDTGLEDSHIAVNGGKVLNKAAAMNTDYTDTDGHGTMCASIICGNDFLALKDPSAQGSATFHVSPGVAPEAKLLVYKVTQDNDKKWSALAVVEALVDIKNRFSDPSSDIRVDVVSITWGNHSHSQDIAKAISDLVSVGVIVVCAASNNGHNFQTPICFPARLGNVLCIGSHNMHGKPSSFSPVGQHLDFLAPGENIVGAGNLDYYHQAACENGTSFAAPAVAGLICLILEYLKRNYTDPAQAEKLHNHWAMKEILREISTNGGTHSNDRGYGTLRPFRFFRNPKAVIDNVFMDVTGQV